MNTGAGCARRIALAVALLLSTALAACSGAESNVVNGNRTGFSNAR